MGDHKTSPLSPSHPRFGSCLEHGRAHTQDHAQWSRRDFLTSMGLATAGGAIVLGGTPLRAFSQSSLLHHLHRLETDRVLVLIQLAGGNDGLNTVIPKTNPIYYNVRPQIAIPPSLNFRDTALNEMLSLHPVLEPLMAFYGEGHMAVIQNVGRPDYTLSHFRETDVWLAGSDDLMVQTGWMGRYLDAEFPSFADDPPAFPLAIQVGGVSPALILGPSANMGMALSTPEEFVRLAEQGQLYDPEAVPATNYGMELAFLRTIANDAVVYGKAIEQAAESGANQIEYPSTELAQQLAIAARLIKGRLGARVYHISLNGFDTHANQGSTTGWHADLLRTLGDAVYAFLADLQTDGSLDKTMVMTFSEFGRRVEQNGSNGTDHGNAAPMFLFSGSLNGGLYGSNPNLSDLDENGNMKFDIDFRSVYATVLKDWFGLPEETVGGLMGGTYDTLGFVGEPTPTAVETGAVPERFTLHQNYPNPFNPTTTITFTLTHTEHVTLRVYDVQGRTIATLVDTPKAAGSHTINFDASGLPSGFYLYRLQAGSFIQTKTMALVK